ncbi:MAG TPA: multicopper oxidase domain-containing protein [candidate division Zixibacteria bacterium]|nr:multicopper oxidase domain-containing protein [candidate division Zixibacteria bacterium]
MNRRKFIKYALVGIGAGIGIGTLPDLQWARAAPVTRNINLAITEAMVEMIDRRLVYHWAFQDVSETLPRMPGPLIEARTGDTIVLSVRNDLPDPHGFRIPGLGVPGIAGALLENGVTIPAGGVRNFTFIPRRAGSYMYIDHLNTPVNRVLGLHGPMVILPDAPALGQKITPYTNPTPSVQNLFNDLGGPFDPANLKRTTAGLPFPGDDWHDLPIMDPHSRTRIWLFNTIDPRFNAQAQNRIPIDPVNFRQTYLTRYFTMNGESGAYIGDDPKKPGGLTGVPHGNIGEPHLIRIMNAGMANHSLHIHANHVYVLQLKQLGRQVDVHHDPNDNSLDGTINTQDGNVNVPFVDTYTARPGDTIDWLLPMICPPDIPGPNNIPLGTLVRNELNLVLGGVPQNPLGYPMHDHNEPSQTAAGGNYNQGVVVHFEFIGDVDKTKF